MKRPNFLDAPHAHVRAQRTSSGFEPVEDAAGLFRALSLGAALLSGLAVALTLVMLLVAGT